MASKDGNVIISCAVTGSTHTPSADRLFGDRRLWSVLGAGAARAVALGGNVLVGLEDSIRAGKARLATSSAGQVTVIRQVIEGQGLAAAIPYEARALLAIPGSTRAGAA